jgi:hypothetical protein
VIEFAKQRNLTNNVAGNASLRRCVGERNALDSDLISRCDLVSAIDDTVRSLTDDFGSKSTKRKNRLYGRDETWTQRTCWTSRGMHQDKARSPSNRYAAIG